MVRMTRARTASNGLGTPPPLDRWIEAVLMLCVSLVHRAATTLGMIFKCNHRDWHTADADEALPQETSGNSTQGTNPTHGVILGLVPRIPVGSSRGLANDPLDTRNQDARVKPEHDSVDVAATRSSTPPPNGGGASRTEPTTPGVGDRPHDTHRQDRATHRPHLTRARCAHLARSSSPVRGRKDSAPA